jgi:hypothetical protein
MGRSLSPIFNFIFLVIFNWRSSGAVTVAVIPPAIGGWTPPPLRGPTSPLPITIITISFPVPVPIISLRSSTGAARTFAIAARAMRRYRGWSTPVVAPNGRGRILGPLKMFSLTRVTHNKSILLPEYLNGILRSIFHA